MPLIPGSVHKSKIVTFLPGSNASGGPATYDDLYILDLATNTLPGLMTAEEKKKLAGIADSANLYSLPAATSGVLGGVKLGSDTVQSVAAVSTPTTKAGRTYPVQKNGLGHLVVNVPWTDTNTVYEVKNLGTFTIPATWSKTTTTVTVTGLDTKNLNTIIPSAASLQTWADCGVYATTEAAGSITFTYRTKPTVALTFSVISQPIGTGTTSSAARVVGDEEIVSLFDHNRPQNEE